jgi:hypothetical protein
MRRSYSFIVILVIWCMVSFNTPVEASEQVRGITTTNQVELGRAEAKIIGSLATDWQFVYNGRKTAQARLDSILEMSPDITVTVNDRGQVAVIEANGGMIIGTVSKVAPYYFTILLDDGVSEETLYDTAAALRVGDKIHAYVNTKNQVKYIRTN